METIKENSTTIWASIIVALATFALTSFFGSWNKLDDTLTQEQVTEQIEESGEEILMRSKQYTDIKFDAATETYDVTLNHIEQLIRANDEKFNMVMKALNERLDRLDQRLNDKQ